MPRQLTTAAQTAKAIRKELKEMGVKASVRSSNFAGGDAVDIYLTNQPRSVFKKVQEMSGKYQYGHFDGMQDYYEISNADDTIPQVKFVMVNNDIEMDVKAAAWRWGLQNHHLLMGYGAPDEYIPRGQNWRHPETDQSGWKIMWEILGDDEAFPIFLEGT